LDVCTVPCPPLNQKREGGRKAEILIAAAVQGTGYHPI
jgi:hypothetical protein